MELLTIVWTFFRIGIISFGGGWSIVGVIQNAVVPRWFDDAGFKSLIAIAQSTPGPVALNTATMVGWNRAGYLGALLATLSVVAFPMMLLAAVLWIGSRVTMNRRAIDESLRSISLAMMLMTFWTLRPDIADPMAILLAAAAFAFSVFTKANAVWVILGSGALNALLGPAIRSLFRIPS